MITKEEREKDRAICEAATPGPWAVDPNAEDRTDVVSVSQRCAVCYVPDEGSPDGAFIAAARDRLPLYIADAEEMDGRIEAILEAARRHETGEIRIDAEGKLPPEVSQALDNTAAAVLRIAVRILRGEK